MEGKRCVGKKKTKIARKTLNPLYQQVLQFEEDYHNKILQVKMTTQLAERWVSVLYLFWLTSKSPPSFG